MDSTIVRVTTIYYDHVGPQGQVWLEIETADGRVGLGESAGAPSATAAWFRDIGAPYLLGQDADDIERHWWALYTNWAPAGIGLETRVVAMVDLALWDLFGKRTGMPLVKLLGGPVRPSIRAYNTCAGPAYYEDSALPTDDRTGIRDPKGKYEDLWAFRHDADRLARELLDMGFGAMKIWPFDEMADESGGRAISRSQLARGLEPIKKIRDAVGDRIDVAIELHGRWDVATAMVIAKALEPYGPLWIEDPVWFDYPAEMAQIVNHTSLTIAAGENLGSFHRFTELINGSGLGLVIADQNFVGGVTAAHRVADFAGQHRRSFACHDCGGPVNLATGVHLALHLENAWYQEMVRAFYFGWYAEVATGLPRFDNGQLYALDVPGHGVELRRELFDRPDAHVETATLSRG
jgi:L-alanine-DL-glutamate epimerase-like enolase superfamily enzyme